MRLTFALAIVLVCASSALASPEDTNQNDTSIDIEPRIVGGRKVPIGKYPFFAAVYRKGGYYCGGTIIAKRYILTAAHCINKKSPSDVWVQVGTVHRRDPNTKNLQVERIIIHENFENTNSLEGIHLLNPNDIALLQLKEDLVYTKYVQPVDISGDALDITSDSKLTAIGLGRVNVTAIPSWLQEVEVYLVPLAHCKKRLKNYSILDNTKICTHGGRGHGICTGDSGGPLLYENNRQIGVSSSVLLRKKDRACQQDAPDVFTRVGAYTSWIHKNTNGAVTETGFNPDSATASLGRYPFYAGIYDSNNSGFVCSGSIIDRNFIMTAAHCFETTVDASRIWVQVGTVRQSDPEMPMFQAQAIIRHEEYKKNVNMDFSIRPNDIALVRLKENIAYGPNVRAVDLTAGPFPRGQVFKATAIGLERVEATVQQFNSSTEFKHLSTSTDIIWVKAVRVDVKRLADCLKLWGQRAVDRKKICGYDSVGQGICIGDTGGPLVYGNRQIGIMSMVDFKDKSGCTKIHPDLYTRVETYLRWIKRNTKGHVMGSSKSTDDDDSSASHTLPRMSFIIVFALINLL